MRAMRKARVILMLGAMSFATAGALAACNGIIGVEDVRLRRNTDSDPGDELGPQDETGPPDDSNGPRPVENIFEVALGLQHSCARKTDFTVKCWGDDSRGQTGTGGTADGGLLAMPQAVGISDAIKIASGQNHTCVVRKSGKVSCWGDNQDGQLGNGQTNARSPTPVDVKSIGDAVAVACGASFSCALRSSGGVACWGNGLGGQLGNGAKQLQPTPGAVSNLTDAIAISAGESHACAVKATGALVCWGDGVNGQLGTGDQMERTTPASVRSLDSIVVVAAASRSTCALKKAGGVFCWGANEIGQLGTGLASTSPNPSPTVVSGLDAIAISGGTNHACAVKRGGAVVCWGAGFQGQIGDGQPRVDASTPTATPANVSGITSAIGVGAGGNHSCAPTTNGTILCWGDNGRGELGTGSPGGQLLTPESVQGYP